MTTKRINRRKFLKGATLAAGATALAACQPATPAATEAPAPAAQPTNTEAPKPAEPTATTAPVEPTATTKPAEPTATEAPKDAASVAKALPRKETLYYAGYQWSPLVGWNPYSSKSDRSHVVL